MQFRKYVEMVFNFVCPNYERYPLLKMVLNGKYHHVVMINSKHILQH